VRLYRYGRRRFSTAPPKEEVEEVTVEAPSDQLAGIVHERDVLAEQYELAEKLVREAEQETSTERDDTHPKRKTG
jgi:hypothetical protein